MIFRMMKTPYKLLFTLVCVSLTSNIVNAKDYKVEVVLFDNNNAAQVSESHDYVAPKPMRSASATWALSPTMLNTAVDKLNSSSNYEVQHHLSWGQESLPYERSAAYTVIEQEARGYIKVYADQLLFANIDIDYKGFRMQEKRRLKLNERHFFDHPKFGILMQVSRLEPEEEADKVDDESGELESIDLESSR